MKRFVFFIFLFFSTILNAQKIYITSLLEGTCGKYSDNPRVIELYVNGTLNVSNYKLQIQLPNDTFWNYQDNIGSKEYTNEFIYLVNDISSFNNEFPDVSTTNHYVSDVAKLASGTSKIRIIDISKNNKVIDVFGKDGVDSNGKSWDYSNSFIQRKDGQISSNTFLEYLWVRQPLNYFNGLGKCNNNIPLKNYVTLGSYNSHSLDIIDEKKVIHLSIFPNPVHNFLNINISSSEKTTLELFSVNGILVKRKKILKNTARLDFSMLRKGVYFLSIKNTKNKFLKKIIIL